MGLRGAEGCELQGQAGIISGRDAVSAEQSRWWSWRKLEICAPGQQLCAASGGVAMQGYGPAPFRTAHLKFYMESLYFTML